MKTRRKLAITVLVFLGILGITLAALLNDSTKGEAQTNLEPGKAIQTIGIPQIDASAPIQTETATFSLG